MTEWNRPETLVKHFHAWTRAWHPWRRRNEVSGDDVLTPLVKVGSTLDVLGKSTEGEFLSIGERLYGFYRRAQEMPKISISVASLMSGEKIEAVMDGFRQVNELIKEWEGGAKRKAMMLRHLFDILAQLESYLGAFHKTVRTLRILCVSTRIQSAYLGGRDIGFNVLADEVGKLSSEIEDRCTHIFSRTTNLSDLFKQTLRRVSDLESAQQAQVGVIIRNIMSSLGSLTEKHSQSSTSAKDAAARYDGISRSMGEIVTSIQFHDITRQRIEHAQAALEQIIQEEKALQSSTPMESTVGSSEAPAAGPEARHGGLLSRWNGREKGEPVESTQRLRTACEVCRLQILQLNNARDTMVSAVENIIDNLGGVAGLVAEMAEQTQKMAGAADETGRSFLAELEAGFSSVGTAFSSYAEADREIGSVTGAVGETLKDMSSFAGDIEGIGQKIKLIALNAIVKAAHMGDEGVTLEVLADSIHQLSVETRRQTELVSETLHAMTDKSEALCADMRAGDAESGPDLEGVRGIIQDLLATLKNVNEDIVALLTRMNQDSSSLSHDIRKCLEEINVHRHTDSVIRDVVSRLEEVTASIRHLCPGEDQGHISEHMKALAFSYTMEEERELHRSLLGDPGSREHSGSSPGSVEKETGTEARIEGGVEDEARDDDLGDNVELF